MSPVKPIHDIQVSRKIDQPQGKKQVKRSSTQAAEDVLTNSGASRRGGQGVIRVQRESPQKIATQNQNTNDFKVGQIKVV